MPLNLEDKKTIVKQVGEVAKNAISVGCAENHGLTVGQMTGLRKLARERNIYLQVVRNTLAKRAIEGTEFSCLSTVLTGPTLLAFSAEEPSAPARLFRDFAKGNEKFVVKAMVVGGQLYPANDLEKIASLPSRDEAISLLMSVMQAPTVKLVRTLAEPYSMVVRVFAALQAKKQAAGE